MGDAANFVSFDSESGLIEIEKGQTNAGSVGQHLLSFTATDENGLSTEEAFFFMLEIKETKEEKVVEEDDV